MFNCLPYCIIYYICYRSKFKIIFHMAGGAQAKMSTWFSKPNQSLISKVTKKRVGFKIQVKIFSPRFILHIFFIVSYP